MAGPVCGRAVRDQAVSGGRVRLQRRAHIRGRTSGEFGISKTHGPQHVRVAAADRGETHFGVDPLGVVVRGLIEDACIPGFNAHQEFDAHPDL